jgi:hypothetical protein
MICTDRLECEMKIADLASVHRALLIHKLSSFCCSSLQGDAAQGDALVGDAKLFKVMHW